MLSKLSGKEILILGTGKEQLPSIEISKKLGLYSLGIDKNKSSDGREIVDEFYNFSIKKIKKINNLIFKRKIHNVIGPCSDIGLKKINKIKNVPKFIKLNQKLMNLCTNKFEMKKFFKENNFNYSNYFLFKNYKDFKKIY